LFPLAHRVPLRTEDGAALVFDLGGERADVPVADVAVLPAGRGDRNMRLLGRGDRPLERRDAELATAVGPA
jgi:hypothetical protein